MTDPNTLRFVIESLGKGIRQLRYLPGALRLVWTSAHRWAIAWICLLLLQGVLPVAVVYLTRTLVDSLVAALKSGAADWSTLRQPVLLAAVMAAILVLLDVLRSLTAYVSSSQAELVQDHIKGLIHDKAVSVDLAYYESPEYHDQLYRARADAYHRPVALVENLGSLGQNGITLVAMAAVLIPFGWWVPGCLLASTVPALWVVVRYAQRQHDWSIRTTSDQRRAWYYDWLVTSREAASELRLFRLGRHFSDAFQDVRSRLRRERMDLARVEAKAEIGAGSFALVVAGSALAWMLVRAARGQVSLGDLAMFYQAFSQGQRLMRSLLETVGQLYGNVLFLENLFEFLAVEPRVSECPRPAAPIVSLERGISFRDIGFRYPSSDRAVLERFNLEIPAGKVVALVGSNGAGKSTLFKLLCRLYDPDSGRVELDGRDIRELRLADLRQVITVLFQEPVHYSETVRRNIEIGNLEQAMPPEAIERSLLAAGAGEIVERLPAGLDTLLGTWFVGGAELSLGEWQRIALSRAFLRDAPIVLLDEPTSAMDSWAEADWMGRFRRLAEGRTSVIITHRLSTAMRADIIHVMRTGKIVESGTHEELIGRSGPYAEAWAAQHRSEQ